jgi:hypothetical protein
MIYTYGNCQSNILYEKNSWRESDNPVYHAPAGKRRGAADPGALWQKRPHEKER